MANGCVEDLAVADDPDLANVLVGDEHRAVRREREVHGEAEPLDLALEPLLRAGDRRGECGGEEDDQRRQPADHVPSVGRSFD